MKRSLTLFPLALLCACSSTAMPAGEGAGVVTVSAQDASAGVETFARPTLKKGDRFVFRFGGVKMMPKRIVSVDPKNGYVVLDESIGVIETYDADFGATGLQVKGRPESQVVFAPVDKTYHWPLWVGKEWTCVHVRKGPNAKPVEELVTYRCEAVETIKVPAGEFKCVRIWRRSQLSKKPGFYHKSGVFWYSPKVGYWVRSLMGPMERVLVEYTRQ